MLILSRKRNQKILIGHDIEISVQRIAGGRVLIGVEAPREMNIARGELVEDKEQAK